MKLSNILTSFLKTGKKPVSSHETASILDEARSALLSSPAVADQFMPEMPAAEFINKAEKALARRPAVIHSTTDQYRRQQGRPPLESGMQVAPGTNKIFNPAPKPAATKPQASTPRLAPTPPNKFHGAPVGLVAQAATHRSSPEADRAQALAELAARGVVLNANGTVQYAVRGGREMKLTNKK